MDWLPGGTWAVLVARLHDGHVDPREAGVGNIVTCEAAMCLAPVGVVNAAGPPAAYPDAIDFAGAHQSSDGREAATADLAAAEVHRRRLAEVLAPTAVSSSR